MIIAVKRKNPAFAYRYGGNYILYLWQNFLYEVSFPGNS